MPSPSKKKVALVVGDASGKGLAAGVRTAEVKFALRAFLREYPHPARALSRLNDFLCDAQRLDRDENTGFTALALLVIDTGSGAATLAMAGSEPPLLVRAHGGDLESFGPEAAGLPLAVRPGEQYPETRIHLDDEDIIVLVTDGIIEARAPAATAPPGGQFFGYERLSRLARQAATFPSLRQMGQTLLDSARAFGGGTLRDDACILLAARRRVVSAASPH